MEGLDLFQLSSRILLLHNQKGEMMGEYSSTIKNGKIFEGRVYEEDEIPPHWNNPTPLSYYKIHISTCQIPFILPDRREFWLKENVIDPQEFLPEAFPLIEDFEMILWNWEYLRDVLQQKENTLYRIRFFSPSRGFLGNPEYDFVGVGAGNLPWLDPEKAVIPWGNFAQPYFDTDQGYTILIAEEASHVYVARGGDFMEVSEKGYYLWYKVEKQRYVEQWEKVLGQTRRYYAKYT